jgi:addiction module RelE/StbE family toxin
MEIRWSPRARARIVEIGDRIALDAPERAIAFEDRLIESVERLRDFPESGAPCPNDETLRQIVLQGYRIVYRVRAETVEIAAILSPGQSFDLEWQKFAESTLGQWASGEDDGL